MAERRPYELTHHNAPREAGSSPSQSAELTRLRADVARLTQERDAERQRHHEEYRIQVDAVVASLDRAEQAEAERDALRARVWMVEAALKSATAILDGEMGNWREHFHADACVINAALALAPEQEAPHGE